MATNLPVEIDQLFGGLNPSEEFDEWFVVHVKPRQEKKLAHYCKIHNINYFLPLQQSTKVYQRRKVTFTKPVFPGYVFLKCSRDQKSILLRSGAIVRFLKVLNEGELLEDLSNVYLATSQNIPIERHPYLEDGYSVRIIKGTFEGTEGIVVDAEDPEQVIIGIHLIQEAICITVSPDDIKVIHK